MHSRDVEPFVLWLRERSLADEKHAPFYGRWVQRFLQSAGPHAGLADADRLLAFADALARDGTLEDWQREQARHAVELYLNRFLKERLVAGKDTKDGRDGEVAGFIPEHGGYKNLLSYQKALVVFQGTGHFVKRWVRAGSRTRDQMEQAARSGKQNIIEGSVASATSKETEIKLTNVARASLEELLEDYRDFLRDRAAEEWPPTHPYAVRLRGLCRLRNTTYEDFKRGTEHADPTIAANVLIGLIRVTIRLLKGQIARLERDFLAEGGLRERMTRARLQARARENLRDTKDTKDTKDGKDQQGDNQGRQRP